MTIKGKNDVVVSKGNSTTPLMVEKVVSAEGNVNLTLETVKTITMATDTFTVTMPVPGTLSYETVKVELAAPATLEGMELLNRYLSGYDVATGLYSYLLANGTVFWMDAFGNVSRIEENDTTMAVGDYTFQYGVDENGKRLSPASD